MHEGSDLSMKEYKFSMFSPTIGYAACHLKKPHKKNEIYSREEVKTSKFDLPCNILLVYGRGQFKFSNLVVRQQIIVHVIYYGRS